MLQHLDLFSGIGGFALACQWAGIETIGFVEIDKYCQKVLQRHWPDVPIVEDIRDVERIKEIATNAQANGRTGCRTTWDRWAGLADSGQNADTGYCGNGNQPTTLITAGFPCQPFSVAGKRGSTEDDRYLWPETLAVIEAIKPEWVLLENVTGIINLALDTVLSDLEGADYSCETLIIPACAVNAWHRRDRIWIVAHAESNGLDSKSPQGQRGDLSELACLETGPCGQDVPNSTNRSPQRSGAQCNVGRLQGQVLREGWHPDYWAVEPELGRVAHGVPHRVDRLKCLGNAIVPQVAYEIIKAIKHTELNV